MNLTNLRIRIISPLLVAITLYTVSVVTAQDAAPAEMLQRTILIRYQSEQGTAFLIDHKGKAYLVTAKHVVTGAPDANAIIKIRQGGEWKDYQTVRTLYPSSRQVDIAVFETNEKVTQSYNVAPFEDPDGPTMGQQVWFLGYPFIEGLGSHFSNGKNIPFIKRGTMSAIDAGNKEAVVFYIDGFNNSGFSGGPIVYWDFQAHKYRILGVVQGYRSDTAKALINGQQVDTNLLVNSGILVGYSIEHAIQAIEQNEVKKP